MSRTNRDDIRSEVTLTIETRGEPASGKTTVLRDMLRAIEENLKTDKKVHSYDVWRPDESRNRLNVTIRLSYCQPYEMKDEFESCGYNMPD